MAVTPDRLHPEDTAAVPSSCVYIDDVFPARTSARVQRARTVVSGDFVEEAARISHEEEVMLRFDSGLSMHVCAVDVVGFFMSPNLNDEPEAHLPSTEEEIDFSDMPALISDDDATRAIDVMRTYHIVPHRVTFFEELVHLEFDEHGVSYLFDGTCVYISRGHFERAVQRRRYMDDNYGDLPIFRRDRDDDDEDRDEAEDNEYAYRLIPMSFPI